MAEQSRPLHPVPEADEDTASSPSSRRPPASFSPSMFRRSGYHRMDSDGAQEMADLDESARASPALNAGSESDVEGLGISWRPSAHRRVSSASSIARRPVGAPKTTPPETPRPSQGLLDYVDAVSPPPQAKRQASWDGPPPSEDRASNIYPSYASEEPVPLKKNAAAIDGTPASQVSGPFTAGSTPGTLNPDDDLEGYEFDDESFHKRFAEPPTYCASRKDIHTKRNSWLSLTIFILSIYSTVMSGIWMTVSFVQPRWGRGISSSRGLQPSSATVVAALVAKTIEMSFVTVFITFVGQVLTRRSFIRQSRGMTLAEMTVRNWVVQPASILTHFETLHYAALTILGALSLTATVAATFYTTASDAMVSPKLKTGRWEHRELQGYIQTSYANARYVKDACPSLFLVGDDEAATSCMNVQLSGQSYRNLQSFMEVWNKIYDNGTSAIVDLAGRPAATALLYDNTTLIGSYIETEHSNVTEHFEKTGKIINNVTLSMPHPGVYAAATNPVNGILQPDDLAGVGEYAVRAGVVSPAINVMCVNMSPDELAPLIYTEWPDSLTNKTGVGDQLTGYDAWEGGVPGPVDEDGEVDFLNKTSVDDIFRWGAKYDRRPPIFQMYPADYNVLTNASVQAANAVPSDAIYMLGKSFDMANYTLCEMRSWVSPNCSTHFNISGTGGASLQAHCEDPNDENSYRRSFDKNLDWSKPSGDWRWVADQWQLSMDLNGAARNNNASNARILTQLALVEPQLNAFKPSMAEALAAYAASTVVISAIDSPFVHWWEYSKPGNIIGAPGDLQPFNASLRTQQYTSGHVNDWQNIFYVILILVFGINVLCLAYFIMRSGLVTDFTEPQNLFALAVNSPPSAQLKGSCGGGPEGRDLVVPWRVAWAPSANHYFFEEASARPWRGKYKRDGASTAREYGEVKGSSYKRLSTSRTWL